MKKNLIIFCAIAYLGIACEENKKTESNLETTSADTTINDGTIVENQEVVDTAGMMAKDGLSLKPVTNSPEFPDAILELNKPEENAKLKDKIVKFNYEIKNYQLTQHTNDAEHKHMANSAKGQHIHLILNNQPYIALYDPNYVDTLEDGHYVALSFLSRSYHESLKHREAYDLRQFTVGKGQAKQLDLTKPMLFYSRPKGEYKGDEIKNILLDFYLVNTELSSTDKKVRATINGTEFMIDKWQPYQIQGLKSGNNTIKLELVDENGKVIEGPYNSVERSITLVNEGV